MNLSFLTDAQVAFKEAMISVLKKFGADEGALNGVEPYLEVPLNRAQKRALRTRKERLDTYTRNLVITTVVARPPNYSIKSRYQASKG